jgi:hypothetical protein
VTAPRGSINYPAVTGFRASVDDVYAVNRCRTCGFTARSVDQARDHHDETDHSSWDIVLVT